MTYTRTNYADVEGNDGMYFLRDALECNRLGFSVIDVADGRGGLEHDHTDDGQEEVYFLVDGGAELRIDEEIVELAGGDAIRVAPEATRDLTLYGDSTMVIVGAP